MKITKSLIIILAVVAIASAATYAIWTRTATATTNTFSTGTPDLQISLTGSDFADSVAGLTTTDLYPGWSQDQDIYLKNTSSANISWDVFPKILPSNGADTALGDQIQLYFTWSDGTSNPTGTYSLTAWENNTTGEDLRFNIPRDQTGHWIAHFSLPSSADDTIVGKTFQFDLQFNGTQV